MNLPLAPVSRYWYLPLALFLAAASAFSANSPISEVMDQVTDVLRQDRDEAALAALDVSTVMQALTLEQRRILATEYWTFTVNVPVVVSIMRDRQQETVPFWLVEYGFKKTDLRVRNESYAHEVWQKSFPAGKVGLGINGFERHRPHYFVGVGPANPADTVVLTDIRPAPPDILPFAKGSYIYHDWTELVLTDVPHSLEGHLLLPTIRGRAREAEIIGAFRSSPSVASTDPDLITLTWSGDPKTSQAIQWRTAPGVQKPGVYWRKQATQDPEAWSFTPAESISLDDRNILNNSKTLWHTATLTGLSPGTCYEYTPGHAAQPPEAKAATFSTAPAQPGQFTFLWLSDTHKKPDSIPLIRQACEKHPDTAFITISGDLVSTGQQRDDWETLFVNYADFLCRLPLVPSIGNHDALDGLGSDLYRALFRLPDNGPKHLLRGQSYSLRYGSLLLVSLDVVDSITAQAAWLEETLRTSDAPWKVAVFHFPPYSPDEDYPEIRSAWGSLFDKYQVDLVLSGHVHYYLRTWPMVALKPVQNEEHGTIYMISVAIDGSPHPSSRPAYAEVMKMDGAATCQAFTVSENRLAMHAYTADGSLYDSFALEK